MFADAILKLFSSGTESPYVLYSVASFEKMFSTMSATLADGRKWLVTNDLTLGDINLMPFVARLAYLNLLDIFIDERTHVQAWWAQQGAFELQESDPRNARRGRPLYNENLRHENPRANSCSPRGASYTIQTCGTRCIDGTAILRALRMSPAERSVPVSGGAFYCKGEGR
jgi:hypothetical protein